MTKLKEAHTRAAKKIKTSAPSLSEQLVAVISAAECDVKKVRSLIRRGADPNAKDDDGDAILVVAARKNLITVAEALLEKGADPDSASDRGQTALMVCSYKGHPEIADMLLAKGANPNTPQGNLYPLALTCQYGYTSIAKGLIDHGALLDVQDSYGNTPLIRAAYEGEVEIVEALLKKGANIEIADNDGRTALMRVVVARCKRDYADPPIKKIRIAELLIEAGAETRHVDKNNHTALEIADGSDHHEIKNMIRDRNEKNDRLDLEQGIPLRHAIKVCSPIKLKFGG